MLEYDPKAKPLAKGAFHHLSEMRKQQKRTRRHKKQDVEESRSLVMYDSRCPDGSPGCSRSVFVEILQVLYPAEL